MNDAREKVRSWLAEHGRTTVDGATLTDATPLIDEGILSSIQVPELLLFIEDLRGRPVEVSELQPGAFRSVDAIVSTFFTER